MSETGAAVVHVIGPDVTAGRLAAARLLRAARLEVQQAAVLVGQDANRIRWPGALNVRAAFNVPTLARASMKRAVQHLRQERLGGRAIILHVWSPQALRWALQLDRTNHELLIETETPSVVEGLPAEVPDAAAFICSTAGAHECLAACGVRTERRWLIRDAVDFSAIGHTSRVILRSRLRIADEETAIALLPPTTRAAGAEYATWAALLLEKARPDIRLIVPGRGDENRHVRYLARASRHEHVLRLAESFSLPQLVAAADMAAYLPIADAPLTALAWAMPAGWPIVASSVPAVKELLEDGRTAWLCRARDPYDGARCMLKALEQPETSTRLAAAARETAATLFSPRTVLEQYSRAYAALGAGSAEHLRRHAIGVEQSLAQ